MRKIISRISLMSISKWRKVHKPYNKGIFTGIKMRPVNYEEIMNLPV